MAAVAYYNEIDPFAAQWLRNLIAAGHIAPGVVDTRSIEDVTPNDLKGFTQCHFFAGVGVWSHALRLAGWPDDKPVWTGSCPCQPFSSAGKGKGFADERHLWPAFHWLLAQRRPVVVFGEQSGSANANDWIDTVQTDMESVGYAFGAVAFPSASVGAPHIRDRTYWVADSCCERIFTQGSGEIAIAQGSAEGKERQQRVWPHSGPGYSTVGWMADTYSEQYQKCLSGCRQGDSEEGGGQTIQPSGLCLSDGLANPCLTGWKGRVSRGGGFATGSCQRIRWT